MNLALITQDFPPEVGGIETYATELALRFAQKCDHFLVMAPRKFGSANVDHSLPYRVCRITASNSFLGLKVTTDAPLLLQKHAIRNTFHAQWQTLPASVFARSRGAVDKIFVAAHARELLFNPFKKIPVARQAYERYKRWLLNKVDLFFPVSDYTAGLLRKHGISDDRIKVVINGTDPSRFYPTNTQQARQTIGVNAGKVLLTVTRLVSRKGVDTALKAFGNVLKDHPDSKYIIVGVGEQKKNLQDMAQQMHISDAVCFTGRVAYQDLISYYNACDVFVMPSKTEPPNVEGFGIVFLEANACGKPVIGTFSGGIPSAVINGETGILVEENNPQALANAIDHLFSNDRMATKIGRQGRDRVQKVANWNVSADKLLHYIKDKI